MSVMVGIFNIEAHVAATHGALKNDANDVEATATQWPRKGDSGDDSQQGDAFAADEEEEV